MLVTVPASAAQYDIDWCVEVGAQVTQGQPLAWLCGPGRCALEPLAAPGDGTLAARWTGLLKVVKAGEPVAVVGGDEAAVAAVRAREAERLAAQEVVVREEVRTLSARRAGRSGAGAALLDADLARLEAWLAAAAQLRHRG